MIQKLKQQTLRRTLVQAVLYLVLAAVLLALTGFGIVDLLRGPRPLESYAPEELEGKYVEATINFLWEPYCYAGEDEDNATEIQYMAAATPLTDMEAFDTAEYIGVAFQKSEIDAAAALYKRGVLAFNSTWDAADLGKPMVVRGTVEQMNEDEQGFYEELLEETGMEDVAGLRLVLRSGKLPGGSRGVVIFLTAAALFLLVLAVVRLVKALTGAYQKDVTRYCAAAADPEAMQARLEELYQGTQPLPGGIYADRERVLFPEKLYTRVLDADRIAWVYMHATQKRVYGISAGTAYELVLTDTAGKRRQVAQRSEADASAALHALFDLLPHAVFGYDVLWEKLFKNDRAAFAALAARQHAAPQAAETVPSADAADAEPAPCAAADDAPSAPAKEEQPE